VPPVNQDLADYAVTARLRLLRLETATVREMLGAYDQALGNVTKELEAIAGDVEGLELMPSRERARLTKLQGELDGRVKLAREDLRERLGAELATTAQAEGPAVLAALEKATPTAIHASLGGVPDVQVVKALTTPIGVRTWSEAIDVGLLEMRDRVQREVAVSLAQGASMNKAARAIRNAAGFVEAYKNQASNIARTEIQRVANSVAHDTYAANLDVIKGVTRLATLDTRTCMVCAPLHNVTWLYGPGGNLLPNPEHGPHITPPLHPRCRCFDAPLTKSFAELGLPVGLSRRDRERLDGSLPQNMTYPEWFGRQSKGRQLEILGPARLKLYEQGKVDIGGFADANRVLSLAELPGNNVNVTLADLPKDNVELSRDEAVAAIVDGLPENVRRGWLRNADRQYKPTIAEEMDTNPELRNAGLNVFHQQYQIATDQEIPFAEFLDKPITVYRAGVAPGTEAFSSYSYDRKIAEKFSDEYNIPVDTLTIKPRDTFGMINEMGEGEVLVPQHDHRGKFQEGEILTIKGKEWRVVKRGGLNVYIQLEGKPDSKQVRQTEARLAQFLRD